MFVIVTVKLSRTSDSIFDVKLLFGSKNLRPAQKLTRCRSAELDRADSDLRKSRTVAEVDSPAALSHPDTSEPVTKRRSGAINMGNHEMPKSRTSRLL
jgi:hypothetical protein